MLITLRIWKSPSCCGGASIALVAGDSTQPFGRRIAPVMDSSRILASFPMDLTEKDASAFAKLREGRKSHIRETRRRLEERARYLTEQSALLKQDIATFKEELATVGIHDYLTGVAHVCACAPLCPAVWSMLSEELVQRIFARLPLPDIIGLRVLSKTWDRYVTGATPGFTQLCAERHPNMFALISEGDCYYEEYPNGPVVINPYDSEGKKWHRFVHETYGLESCETMCAGDGGLVFLVSTLRGPFPMIMVVFNPLTRQWRTLPTSSSLSSIRPRMVQLVMDRDSKGYKVLVVGPKTQGGDPVARIFSSATGKWSKPNIVSDLIFGWQYRWHDGPGHGMVTGKKAGPCAYDCATRTLLELDGGGYPCRHGDQRVLVKDRLFVLHFKIFHDRYVLKEYQFQRGLPHWVKLKDHECYELNYVYGGQGTVALDTQLFGCQNYLVVFACQACQTADECTNRIALLFDLSTCEWQIISEVPGWHPFHHHSSCDMFELRWDAVP